MITILVKAFSMITKSILVNKIASAASKIKPSAIKMTPKSKPGKFSMVSILVLAAVVIANDYFTLGLPIKVIADAILNFAN